MAKEVEKPKLVHNKVLFWIIVALVILFILLMFYIRTRESSEGNKCFSDDDCIRLQVSCCPCNAGGQEECVLKDHVDVLKKQLESCPAENELTCAQAYNCQNIACRCINSTCVK